MGWTKATWDAAPNNTRKPNDPNRPANDEDEDSFFFGDNKKTDNLELPESYYWKWEKLSFKQQEAAEVALIALIALMTLMTLMTLTSFW